MNKKPTRCIDPCVKFCQECKYGWVKYPEWVECYEDTFGCTFESGCMYNLEDTVPTEEEEKEFEKWLNKLEEVELMSKRTQLLHKLKHVYSHNTKLVLDVENKDIELIIEGLEKQVAKKPVIWADGTEHCPYCEHDLTYISSEDEYCCRCGQKLDYRLE